MNIMQMRILVVLLLMLSMGQTSNASIILRERQVDPSVQNFTETVALQPPSSIPEQAEEEPEPIFQIATEPVTTTITPTGNEFLSSSFSTVPATFTPISTPSFLDEEDEIDTGNDEENENEGNTDEESLPETLLPTSEPTFEPELGDLNGGKTINPDGPSGDQSCMDHQQTGGLEAKKKERSREK
ncbi:hypothetical protein BKA69DRAFT_1071523 [Paraphysoderma sedebokerense]|nr:hypothetical protein BKA69DRAFT_1071523 [Paraphysoderma sedebokerense]